MLDLKTVCGSNKCAKCARGVHFYYGFIMILDGPILCTCLNLVLYYFFSLGKPKSQYRWDLIKNCCILLKGLGCHFLCFCRYRNYEDFLLQFIWQDAPTLILVTLTILGLLGGVYLSPPVLFWFGDSF